MKKILAVVRRTDDGFRGYVPKLPGCEIRAATAAQAEADIASAARARLAAGKEGTNGAAADPVEIAVVVEPEVPEQYRGDGEEAALMRWGYELPNDDMLEALLNPEEHEWEEMDDAAFDQFLHELEEPADRPKGGTPK